MADDLTDLFDAQIRSVLRASEVNRQDQELRNQIALAETADPTYGDDHLSVNTEADREFYETRARMADRELLSNGRNLGEHLQDAGAGLLGTLDTIGNTIILAGSVGVDGVDHLVRGDDANWNATKDALESMNSGREFTTSLQSAKSDAFDRISQYRQDKAVEQAKLEGAGWVGQQVAAFGAAAGSYLEDPGQIVTDGIAQTPYLVTGGIAKGVSPLLGRLTQKMSTESAQKLLQMGLVGGMQGTIEGADAAASVYERVMSSTDTFSPDGDVYDEANRETYALRAAAAAFGNAAAVSAVTGTLASKFELAPFGSKGATALSRTGDNLVKALQEGVQETIESGNSQFVTNYAGNQVLKGKDLVALEEGVGGAAGTGFMVGAGSTVVTNPRAALDAAVAPLSAVGMGKDVLGSRQLAKEYAGDLAATNTVVDDIVANVTTPAAVAAAPQGRAASTGEEITTDTPSEDVPLPPEMAPRATDGPIGQAVRTFATGMQYLRGKDMNSTDAVTAFHVLGAVMESAVNIKAMRDGAALDAADEALPAEERAKATETLAQLKSLVNDDLLDKWVADYPMEDIEESLQTLQEYPEEFGRVVAHFATVSPLKMPSKVLEAASGIKGLSSDQRQSIKLAQELKEAEAELAVGTSPDTGEVSRSIMQTGFPGARDNKQSIADMLRNVTGALAENETDIAQSYFQKLATFSTYLTDRSGRFNQALKDMNASGEKFIDVPDTRTWVKGALTDTPFRLIQGSPGSLAVKVAAQKDAEAVAKMVTALQKRTGLIAVTKALVATPAAKPAPAAKVATPKAEKAAPVAVVKSGTVDKTDPGNLTDAELDAAIDKIPSRRGFAYDILTKERDSRISATMVGTSDREVSKPAAAKPAVKLAAVSVVTVVDEEVIEEETATETATINVWYGSGENAEFSNLAPRPFSMKERVYLSVEHAYQTLKSGVFDQATYDKYTSAGKKIVGKLGTKTENNWNIKLMSRLVYESFKQNPEAAKALLATGTTPFSHSQDKGVWKEAFPQALEQARVRLQQEGETVVAPEVAVTVNSTKNHLKDLMPDYPVADDATGTDKNDATNHLLSSFSTSDQPGLMSKGELLADADKLQEKLGITEEEDVRALSGLVGTKNTILRRLQTLIGGTGALGKAKAKALQARNLWKGVTHHFLYAAKWSPETGVAYQEDIAQVMAWTGVQHMMDMINPVTWSNDLIQQLQDTYGSGIREKLMDGWLPLKEQTEELARKLQANLELRADKSVSVEYTEGTMIALAGRIIESMITTLNYKEGVLDHDTFMTAPPEDTDMQPLPVQWIRMSVDKTGQQGDMLFTAARILEDFLPERASTSQAHIGTPPKGVNPFYRGSNQEIGKEQKAAIKKRNGVKHYLSPLMYNVQQAIKDGVQAGRLFGMDPAVKDFPSNGRDLSASQIARKGKYNTTKADLMTIQQHMLKVDAFAKKHGMSIHEVESYFEYEQVTNGRAMTKGTSPQSSKWYRELFAIAQYQVDPSKDNRGFRMAVAQGLGIKMDIQNIDNILDVILPALLAQPDMQRAMQAAARLGESFDYSKNAELLEADLTAIEALAAPKSEAGLGIELSPHAMSALVHYAEYQKGQPFTSSLMYEIDGKTDGPINLMMLMGLAGSADDMEKKLGLGGVFYDVDGSPISVQDMTEQLKQWHGNSKDLYEIIKNNAAKLNPEIAQHILAAVEEAAPPQHKAANRKQTEELLSATMFIVRMAGLSKNEALKLVADYERAFAKKSTQAAGYLQGGLSISGDLLNTITEALSARIDKGDLTEIEKKKIAIFFGGSLGSKKDVPYLNYKPYLDINGYQMVTESKPWDGKPLSHKNWMRARATLNTFIGSALFGGLQQEIGFQRKNMMAAVTTMQIRVQYADHVMRTRYKAKQNAEVEAGRLHPGQALSKNDEQAIFKDIFEKLIPHPMLRNTGGLPVASSDRTNGNPMLSSVKLDNTRRIENHYFAGDKSNEFRHWSGLTETTFEAPGVSFAALSIMAAGDGSMMTGLFAKMLENVLDMYDGLYMSPEIIDKMGELLNQEVEENWQHDFIGAILTSLQVVDNPEFQAWAEVTLDKFGTPLSKITKTAEAALQVQHEQQLATRKDINTKGRWVSHMAGHGKPAYFPPEAFNSTSLGTTETDPLLDLASDSLGQVNNDIRKMSATDVKALLKDHTFENPVLSGLWKALAPLVSDNLTLFMSPDKQALADFYKQSERREMGRDVDGVSIGDRVYIRAINAETIVHELLHATTKNLTAAYFTNPSLLTTAQRDAMKNLLALMDQFLALSTETMSPHQQAMVEHVQGIMNGYWFNKDINGALQEFLAYGLSNYHLQRKLGDTKSVLGKMLESVFNAVKALFGFPNGTQSDSMLAAMFSNFSVLTEGAVNVTYPVSVDEALESVNPRLARSFSEILFRLEKRSATLPAVTKARADGRIRMQELANTKMQGLGNTNLFPKMSNEELTGGEYIQAVFALGLKMNPKDSALLVRVVDAVRDHGPAAWRSNADPVDQADIDLAQARYDYFFKNTPNDSDQVADILSMALVNPEFASYMEKIILPRKNIDKESVNNLLDSTVEKLHDLTDTGVTLKPDANLSEALELAALRMRKTMLASAKRKEAKPGPYRKLTDKLTEGVQYLGEQAGKLADARQQMKGNKDWISSGLMLFAGTFNDNYADMLGKWTLGIANQMEGKIPLREVVDEIVGTNSHNFKLIQLKGRAARMVSAIRQSFREQVPVSVKSWFKDLNPELDELLHKVIGRSALYSLSQDLKDRLPELLTENGVSHAITAASRVLMAGGDSYKKSLMIKHAKNLGDRMAGVGNQALYLNTAAIAGMAVESGAAALSADELEALENLSTLQALSHLTPTQRRATLTLFRENTEAFWKTTTLINSFFDFDTSRAGKGRTATLNFQKGWIPTQADGRKKVKLFKKAEVRAAERLGWVVVPGASTFKDDADLVYMATEVGQTPTLSGGAIHAVDRHMNGIHYHSGMPTDPSIQTIITNPKAAREIRDRILKGEVVPYTALFDAAGDVVGFQRLMDPAIMDRHTKSVGRISDAAGIWLGRMHEEQAANSLNEGAAKLLRKTWDEGVADKTENEFVNIRQPYDRKDPNAKYDKVLLNVWETLPYTTKLQLEAAFANGTKNPPIWIRRDQLNDAIGYHKASVGNFFTGDNRYDKTVNASVAALSRQFLGKGAYKYLVVTEAGWQGIISSAKDTIIVKSLTVLLDNLASNQIQLLAVTGNPVWNARVQAEKYRELVAYLGYQKRVARLNAEDFSTNDVEAKKKIEREKAYLKAEIRKLSIWPLIDSGDLPTIAEGTSETEEYSWVGDMTAKLEEEVGKLPPALGTLLNNVAISKETSIYKMLDRGVQYGDFVAKAAMYEWLVTNDKATKVAAIKLFDADKNPNPKMRITMEGALSQLALMEINDEFINYSRLPGRTRTYLDDMGLTWFYHYKLRILKMGFRRMRKNPASFLIGSQIGSMLGVATLVDTLPGMANFSYSTGLDPLFSAPNAHMWVQLVD